MRAAVHLVAVGSAVAIFSLGLLAAELLETQQQTRITQCLIVQEHGQKLRLILATGDIVYLDGWNSDDEATRTCDGVLSATFEKRGGEVAPRIGGASTMSGLAPHWIPVALGVILATIGLLALRAARKTGST